MSELDGATELPGEGKRISTAGQFAARWNGMDSLDRQRMVTTLMDRSEQASRCFIEDHVELVRALREQRAAVRALHPPKARENSMVLWCDHDENPWPCPTARAVGVPTADTEHVYAALRIRAVVDAIHERVTPDGSINASHVAAESTLREREGLPGYIAELDGPGRFL